MCTLHLFYKVFDDHPIIFAANRDELLKRPWTPPGVLAKSPLTVGPRDSEKGGSWLGVNEHGVVASLANHYGTLGQEDGKVSRGHVVMEALKSADARSAVEQARQLSSKSRPHILLVADPESGFVIDHNDERVDLYELEPGCHVITNEPFRHPDDAKAKRSLERMRAIVGGAVSPDGETLFEFLRDHEATDPNTTPLCVHPKPDFNFGTSSASVIKVAGRGRVDEFHFCAGPPCTAAHYRVVVGGLDKKGAAAPERAGNA